MLRIGIIGKPNAGKSTLFNILTNAGALVADYAFSTIESNRGVLWVRDQNADQLLQAIGHGNIQCSQLEVVDIAGLIEGSSQGEGLGTQFLGDIKDCHVLVQVLRDGSVGDQNSVDIEIAKFDHTLLQKPFEKARRMVRLYPKEKEYVISDQIITKAYYGTKDNKPIRDVLSDDELKYLPEGIGLLSMKPRLLLNNFSTETETSSNGKTINTNLLILSQLVGLSMQEIEVLGYKPNILEAFNNALTDLILKLAGQKKFYTVGHLGVGVWVIGLDADSELCASLIHDDMGDNINGVKVASLNNFLTYKSWDELSKSGLVKKYNKNYKPANSDILLFD